jgi:hypothetical protein
VPIVSNLREKLVELTNFYVGNRSLKKFLSNKRKKTRRYTGEKLRSLAKATLRILLVNM